MLDNGCPFSLPFWNTVEPELEPVVPFKSAVAVVVMEVAEAKPLSRFRFEIWFWLVAWLVDPVICPEALLLSVPVLPMTEELSVLTLFVAEPPLQLIAAVATGPTDGTDPPSPRA